MFGKFLSLALIMGSVLVTGCQVQTTNFKEEQLLTRVRDLELAMKQLIEMQNSQTDHSNTAYPTTVIPEVPLSINLQNGLTLGHSGNEKGFHVVLRNDVTVGIEEKIKFDLIIENIGRAYNAVSSEFICPTSGTYLLSLSIACQKGSYAEVSVEINRKYRRERSVLNTICDHRKRTPSDGSVLYCGQTQNGGSAIISLQKGDVVSVKKLWPIRTKSTILGKGFSTFTGYLLRPSQT